MVLMLAAGESRVTVLCTAKLVPFQTSGLLGAVRLASCLPQSDPQCDPGSSTGAAELFPVSSGRPIR